MTSASHTTLSIRQDEVHAWIARRAEGARMEELHAHLSRGERERVSRFRFDEDAYDYITAHGALREVLGTPPHTGPLAATGSPTPAGGAIPLGESLPTWGSHPLV